MQRRTRIHVDGAHDEIVHVEHLPKLFAARQYQKLLGATAFHHLREDPALAFVLEDGEEAYQRAKEGLSSRGASLLAGNWAWGAINDRWVGWSQKGCGGGG